MKFSKRYVVLMVFLAAMLVFPQSLMAAPLPPLDLKTDVNRDGVADALAAAVNEVEAAKDPTAAIEALTRRMPYSRETRRLQARAARLQAELMYVETLEEAQAIYTELDALSERMMADPAYVAAQNSLEKLYLQRGVMAAEQSATNAAVTPAAVSWGSLQRGDVMLIRSGWLPWTAFVYAMWYSHAGTYHGNSLVYESNADGVRLKPLSNWQGSGQYIALGRNNRRAMADVQASLTWAEGYYGTDGRTPYNFWFPDRNTDSRLYCSQLVWKIHQRTGVDLDSNAWEYHLWAALKWGWWAVPAVVSPAVAPDEVGLDSDVTYYSKAWN